MELVLLSFDKDYPNRKDHRKVYRGAKAIDATCRNHGSCPYCRDNRIYNTKKRIERAEEMMKEWVIE